MDFNARSPVRSIRSPMPVATGPSLVDDRQVAPRRAAVGPSLAGQASPAIGSRVEPSNMTLNARLNAPGTDPRSARTRLLPPRAALLLPRLRDVRLTVLAGRLWITREGDLDDRFVGAGESLDIADARAVVIEADGAVPTTYRLQPMRAQDVEASGWAAPRAGRASEGPAGGPARAFGRFARRVAAVVLAALVSAVDAHLRVRERRMLLDLDDRTLRDVGVSDALRRALRAERAEAERATEIRNRCGW